ncbi:MAG: hypothetical protein WAY93_05705 [Atopobiaceae bacterium]|jgi:hypothetical protein|nr:hypothetical protein [Atopobiaceae bacterium]
MISPLAIDGTELPQPVPGTYDVRVPIQDSEHETESGGTQRNVIRTGRRLVSGTWRVTPRWVAAFHAIQAKKAVSVTAYVPQMGDVETFDAFVSSDLEAKAVEGSERIGSVAGLYDVTLQLTEF